MTLSCIVSGDFGQTIKLTLIDKNTKEPADVSQYDTKQEFWFLPPDETVPVIKEGTFDTDGSDGVVAWPVEESFLVPGRWLMRARLYKSNAMLSSVIKRFTVEH